MDLASGMSAAEKQRRIAEELRKRAMVAGPEGQMVSGHYVAPSMFQQLAPLANAAMSVYADKRATEAENASRAQIDQAKQQWQSSLPQAVAQQTQPFMAPGIDGLENIPGTQTVTQQAQPLTNARILKHALAGMDIPGNEKAAAMYNQSAQADLAREDAQQARKEEQAASRVAAAEKQKADLEWKQQQLNLMLEQRGLDRESKERLAAQHAELTKAIAAATDATRRAQIEMQRELGQARIDAAKAKGAEPKPVSTTVMKELGGLENNARGISDMAARYKPEYGGIGGNIDRLSGTWNPFSSKSSDEAANWWKDYENQAALVERHEKFGTALSAGEQAAWKNATISPGMNPQAIEHNLKERARIANDLFNRTRGAYIKAGHTGVGDAFEERPVGSSPGTLTVVRTGKDASGRTVQQMSDGSIRYAD